MSTVQISKFGISGSKTLTVDNNLSNEIKTRIKEGIKINEELTTQSAFDRKVTQLLADETANRTTAIGDLSANLGYRMDDSMRTIWITLMSRVEGFCWVCGAGRTG